MRILQHVLPKGLQRVRDFGFLRGSAKKLRLTILHILAAMRKKVVKITANNSVKPCHLCPNCNIALDFVKAVRNKRPSMAR